MSPRKQPNGKCKVDFSHDFNTVIRLSAIANIVIMTRLNSRMVCAVAISEPQMVQIKETGGGCEQRKRRNEWQSREVRRKAEAVV
jgi:hypothetical protein